MSDRWPLIIMTIRKMLYTKSCIIIEMCGRLKFRKLIPEGNLSCGIRERLLVMTKACSIYSGSVSKGLQGDAWLRRQSWSRHNQTRLLFRDQDKTKSFIQGSRDKIKTFTLCSRGKTETFATTTRVKSKTFIKRTRVDSRPETLVSRSQVWRLL